MSWAEIKKAVNSNLDVPLNELITKKYSGFTPSSSEARTALTNLGFTERGTMTMPDGGTVHLFFKNAKVKDASWDEAYEICTNYYKEINKWASDHGYGNICIASRMPAYTDTGSWLPSNTWTGTQNLSYNTHYYWTGSGYNLDTNDRDDSSAYGVVPVAFII